MKIDSKINLAFILTFIAGLLTGILPCTTAKAQVFAHVGTSPLKGNIGLELQPINHFSISAGVKTCHIFTIERFYSYSAALNTYFNIGEAICYASVGAATKGVVRSKEYMWDTPTPAGYVMIGTRYYPHVAAPRVPDRLSFDIGIGASATKYTKPELVIDFEISWMLFKLNNH